jgi:hypothetical protein
VQRGTYQALMDQPGMFRDLATRQLAGEPPSIGAAAADGE